MILFTSHASRDGVTVHLTAAQWRALRNALAGSVAHRALYDLLNAGPTPVGGGVLLLPMGAREYAQLADFAARLGD